MKHNVRILFFSCLFLTFFQLPVFVTAQQPKWSQPLQDDKKLQYMKILGADDDGFYILRSNISFDSERDHVGFRSRKFQLSFFGNDMKQKWQQQIIGEKGDSKIIDVQMVNNKVLVVSSTIDKSAKTFHLFAQYLNSNGINEGQPKKLDEFSFEKTDDDDKPQVVTSHNQMLTAFAYRKLLKEKDYQFYEAVVFDTNLTIIYRKEITVPLKAKLFSPIDIILTDEGNFFLLGMQFTTEKKVKAANESFYQLYSYNYKKDLVTSNEIKAGNKFLTGVNISADNLNHKIVIAGFYSDANTYSTAGVFYYSISENDSSKTPFTTSPFCAQFLQKFMGEKKENNNKELANYSIDRVVLRKDGGAVLVAESFYNSTRSYWDYYTQMYISHRYYHFGNIMALSINPDGTILWCDVISKDQNSTDDDGYFSSYCSAINEGKMFCIYNKYISDPSSVLMSSIASNGEQKTKVLYNEVENVSVIAGAAQQVDEDNWLLPVYRGNKFYLVKLTW